MAHEGFKSLMRSSGYNLATPLSSIDDDDYGNDDDDDDKDTV